MSQDQTGYAVIYQDTLWGSGKTPESAIHEALLWLNDQGRAERQFAIDDIEVVTGRQVDCSNKPFCVPCTEQFLDSDPSGDTPYHWTEDNFIDLGCE